jgi:hypothetical protein
VIPAADPIVFSSKPAIARRGRAHQLTFEQRQLRRLSRARSA